MPRIHTIHLFPGTDQPPDVDVFDDAAAHRRYLLDSNLAEPPRSVVTVRTREDLSKLTGPQLIAVHNRLTTREPVRRFADLETARTRVFNELGLQPVTNPAPIGPSAGDAATAIPIGSSSTGHARAVPPSWRAQ